MARKHDAPQGGESMGQNDSGVGQNDSQRGLVLQKVTPRKRGRDIKPHGPKPGEVRNPGGRTRGATLSESYRTALSMAPADLAKMLRNPYSAPLNMAELIAAAIVSEAAKGKITHAMELADRTEGKVAVRPNLGSELLGILAEAYADDVAGALPVGADDESMHSPASVPSHAVPVHNSPK